MGRTTRERAGLAVLYTRVSTQEQAQGGVSLRAQEEKLQDYCRLRDLTITEVICDAGVSGGKPLHTREGGQRVLEMVKSGAVGHVVTYKLDRLFRDCADCLTVTACWNKKEVALHLVDLGGQTLDTSTSMGRFFLTVMAGAAELERNLVRERTADALASKKNRGEKTGGDIPYGYQLASDGKTLIEDPKEKPVLDFIRQCRDQGLSLRKIVEALDKNGYRSRSGKPFILTQVVRIIEGFDRTVANVEQVPEQESLFK